MIKITALVLLGICIVCLVVGIILLPKGKQVIPDLKAMINAVIYLVAGYITGQAGLFLFITALTQERLQKTELLLSRFLSDGRPAEAAHPQH
ncbi:MAG: hypothetical protein PHH86_06925 [Sphaerochaetaceae bacterium]|nr:hypothetical protein [Sphaerochaetaceae bacterium]